MLEYTLTARPEPICRPQRRRRRSQLRPITGSSVNCAGPVFPGIRAEIDHQAGAPSPEKTTETDSRHRKLGEAPRTNMPITVEFDAPRGRPGVRLGGSFGATTLLSTSDAIGRLPDPPAPQTGCPLAHEAAPEIRLPEPPE